MHLLPAHDCALLVDVQHRTIQRWSIYLISTLSYMLMLSDVLRTGLGVKTLSDHGILQPDEGIFFGPFAYSVTHELTVKDADVSGGAIPLWPYKYDSTSVGMRALNKLLALPEWPACVAYEAMCDERDGLSRVAVFRMIDALVEGVKRHAKSPQTRTTTRPSLSMRVKYAWFDRVHDYALPWFFPRPNVRTCQAIHYDMPQVRSSRTFALCGSTLPRPLSCGDSWTNFDRHCDGATNPYCQGVGDVWSHITIRMQDLQARYRNSTVDFVMLEGTDDFTRSSVTFQGSKFADIVTLARVRECEHVGGDGERRCHTIVVDDFRYEIASMVTNAPHWYTIVALLRAVGQSYAWLRLLFLFGGTYGAKPCGGSRTSRLLSTIRTVELLPSQVVVYGSIVPIACYVVAHLIDSGSVYTLMGENFYSLMGFMNLELLEIFRLCAVSMRSLWVLAFIGHLAHRFSTRCSWSPIHGVLGVPEFSFTFVAALTVSAQVRLMAFRDSRILQVMEVVPSSIRSHWARVHFDSSHGFVYKFVAGSAMDCKSLVVASSVLLAAVVASRLVTQCCPRVFTRELVLFPRTLVPFSAGTLWQPSALVVNWSGALTSPVTIRPTRSSQGTIRVIRTTQRQSATLHIVPTGPTAADAHDFASTTMLMNLVAMTDPLTWLRLRLVGGRFVGLFQVRDSQRLVLLPLGIADAASDIPIDWGELELKRVVDSTHVSWGELLQCR